MRFACCFGVDPGPPPTLQALSIGLLKVHLMYGDLASPRVAFVLDKALHGGFFVASQTDPPSALRSGATFFP